MSETIKKIFEKIKNYESLSERELRVVYVALKAYDAFDSGLNEVLGLEDKTE